MKSSGAGFPYTPVSVLFNQYGGDSNLCGHVSGHFAPRTDHQQVLYAYMPEVVRAYKSFQASPPYFVYTNSNTKLLASTYG